MKKRTRAQPDIQRTMMYCGPDIPGVASPGLLFTEEHSLLTEHLDLCPALRTFIIAPKDYVRVKQAIAQKGSLEHAQYTRAKDYLRNRRS